MERPVFFMLNMSGSSFCVWSFCVKKNSAKTLKNVKTKNLLKLLLFRRELSGQVYIDWLIRGVTEQLCSAPATRKMRRRYDAKWTESASADWRNTFRTRLARRWLSSNCWSACRPTRTCWTWAESWWPRSDGIRTRHRQCTASCRVRCCYSARTKIQRTYVGYANACRCRLYLVYNTY